MKRTTAFGLYDHGVIGLLERITDHQSLSSKNDPRQRFWIIRAKHIILATGAIERPIAFGNNDRPGVMSVNAARTYLNRFSILPGKKIIVCTNNDSAYLTATELAKAGAEVKLIDVRPEVEDNLSGEVLRNGVILQMNAAPLKVHGSRAVRSLDIATAKDNKWQKGNTEFCDLVTAREQPAGVSDLVRGVFIGGTTSRIDYITIATGGNAGNFGNYAESRTGHFSGDSALSDGFYCVTQGRKTGQSYYDYWSINTLSDSTKWGDQRTGGVKDAEYISAVSNGTRGVWCGGYDGSWSKKMDYLSFATQGNALQYGEMLQYKHQGGGVSDGQRGVVGGDGYRDPTPILEYFNISTAAGSAVVSATFGLCQAPNNIRQQAAVYAGD